MATGNNRKFETIKDSDDKKRNGKKLEVVKNSNVNDFGVIGEKKPWGYLKKHVKSLNDTVQKYWMVGRFQLFLSASTFPRSVSVSISRSVSVSISSSVCLLSRFNLLILYQKFQTTNFVSKTIQQSIRARIYRAIVSRHA